MNAPAALLDSNVLIAAVHDGHIHHPPSLALLTRSAARTLAVAAHSYAEAYSNLTRRSPRIGFHWPADEAWAALESIAAATVLVGLSPARTFDAVRAYAAQGGVGRRLYDHLIGKAAVEHGLRRVVTWNVAHLASLFPDLDVVDPIEALANPRPSAAAPGRS